LFGLQTPAEMFAAASRMEMEAQLSRVLRKQGVAVADQHLPVQHTLFVNTHPAELECGGLEDSLFEIRDHHPDRPIALEVHESVLNHPENALRLRSTLKSLNIQLAFHDFGAGRIRLADLGEFVPDVVKFDVKLIQGIDQATSQKQKLVASLVRMALEMGITPLAECVEQPAENEVLRQLGFKLGQGFLYGRPCSIEDCSHFTSPVASGNESGTAPLVKPFLHDTVRREAENVSSAPVSPTGPKDAQWLLTRPQHYYTIQVLSAISHARALEYTAKQENPEQFAIFCKQGKTRMLYIVVYGLFEDRSAAKAASTKLADAAISPWIRMLSSVHAEIRSGSDTGSA
jgi:EAL domain-containing protein (putative c-di-GMP-specific phosphodiesterase class I)